MRNKFYNFIVAWFFLLFFCNSLFASDVIIDAKTVDITDGGNVIIAVGSVNITDGVNITITGDKAKYNKLNQNLEIFGNVILIDKEKNYKLSGKKVIFDRQKNLIDAYENIVFNDFVIKSFILLRASLHFQWFCYKIIDFVKGIHTFSMILL